MGSNCAMYKVDFLVFSYHCLCYPNISLSEKKKVLHMYISKVMSVLE